MVSFGTKAETLERLRGILKSGTVLPQVSFTVGDWLRASEQCVELVQSRFEGDCTRLIVRSSAICEDSGEESKAGAFRSIADVNTNDMMALSEAVRKVIHSYGKHHSEENQVLVQPYLTDVVISGVAFTRDVDTLAPYYVINYDDYSRATGTITQGRSSQYKTRIIYRNFPRKKNDKFDRLIEAIKELEEALGCDYLDVEFAVGRGNIVYILQVRPLFTAREGTPQPVEIDNYLEKIYKKIGKLNKRHPYLYGDRTIFGVMPDWNPAEMIGVKPRPLPLSLYKELITDRTWAYQRNNYGYKNVRSFPLIVTFLGMPYVDVRASFNSFIPAGIDEGLAEKLTNYYLDTLRCFPHLHDKIEFDVILSCYFFNIDTRLAKLREANFTSEETCALKRALLDLTKNIVKPERSVIHIDQGKIELLKQRQKKVMSSTLSRLEKVYWLVEDCKRYGTLPFAGLARAGFIAVQMLRSLVETGIISEHDKNQFIASLNTVAKKMMQDRYHLSREEFIKFYGHLRPGTYDILSLRYDEAYDYYFGDSIRPAHEPEPFVLGSKKRNRLDALLKKEDFPIDAQGLMRFFKEAIEGREYAKFIFTRSVSDILRLIKEIGERYSLSVDDVSYIDIKTLLNLYATLDHRDLSKILGDEISRSRHFYEVNKFIRLPHIILDADDIYEFELDSGMPNFIGTKRCMAEVVAEKDFSKRPITGKIVFILSADPGYDWIFSKGIAGLVTVYGGANSHMAIRAAELKIPSVIGAGERNYKHWSLARMLEIDPENRQVRIIS